MVKQIAKRLFEKNIPKEGTYNGFSIIQSHKHFRSVVAIVINKNTNVSHNQIL